MTNEEAINVLEDYDINFERHTAEEVAEAHEMAIKALKAQPCEDCVSREAVLSIIKSICFSEEYLQFRVDHGSNGQRDAVINCIKALPSVSPQPSTQPKEECDCISRKGHWIWCASSHKCSNCGGYVCFSHKKLLKYCPNCGARMEG